jgi:hypothetical protein
LRKRDRSPIARKTRSNASKPLNGLTREAEQLLYFLQSNPRILEEDFARIAEEDGDASSGFVRSPAATPVTWKPGSPSF